MPDAAARKRPAQTPRGAPAGRAPWSATDTALRTRQADGLTALLAIAAQASVAMSQASTSLIPAAPAQDVTGTDADRGPARGQGRVPGLIAALATAVAGREGTRPARCHEQAD